MWLWAQQITETREKYLITRRLLTLLENARAKTASLKESNPITQVVSKELESQILICDYKLIRKKTKVKIKLILRLITVHRNWSINSILKTLKKCHVRGLSRRGCTLIGYTYPGVITMSFNLSCSNCNSIGVDTQTMINMLLVQSLKVDKFRGKSVSFLIPALHFHWNCESQVIEGI